MFAPVNDGSRTEWRMYLLAAVIPATITAIGGVVEKIVEGRAEVRKERAKRESEGQG